MNVKDYKTEIEVPEGVTVTISDVTRDVEVSGKEGKVVRKLYSPGVSMKVEGNKVVFEIPKFTKREKKMLGTFRAHINNMFSGVMEKHVYKLKICSGHFPMNVSYNNGELIVKNFFGEKHPRILKIEEAVDFKLNGSDIEISSVDVEAAGRAAAAVERLTSRPGFDRRIFQDGIYIVEKRGKRLSDA